MRKRDEWPAQDLAALIAEVLRRTGITQRQLAEMADVDPSQVGRWKTGAARPGYDILHELGHMLTVHYPHVGVGADELLTAAGYREPTETREDPFPPGSTHADRERQLDAEAADIAARMQELAAELADVYARKDGSRGRADAG